MSLSTLFYWTGAAVWLLIALCAVSYTLAVIYCTIQRELQPRGTTFFFRAGYSRKDIEEEYDHSKRFRKFSYKSRLFRRGQFWTLTDWSDRTGILRNFYIFGPTWFNFVVSVAVPERVEKPGGLKPVS